jgi:hypothetical protein
VITHWRSAKPLRVAARRSAAIRLEKMKGNIMEISASKLCDDILNTCCMLDETQRGTNWSFEQYLSAKGIPRTRTRNTLRYLEKEGYLVKDNEHDPHSLTIKGELLRESGGFAGQKKRDAIERKSRCWTIAATITSAVAAVVMAIAICLQVYIMSHDSPSSKTIGDKQSDTIQQSQRSQQSGSKSQMPK